jgi:hypothetical protein
VCAITAALVTACATVGHSDGRSASIRVYEMAAAIPVRCASLGLVTIRDGRQGEHSGDARDGSRDRALRQLREKAASRGGTAIAIREEPEITCVDCFGLLVEIRAEILRCPP